jgi:esterase
MINNYPMAYLEQGQGEPLLLIHGSLSDYRTWRKHLNDFSENNRSIAVSLRHYFPEKWDGRGNDLGIEQDVDDMAAFIKKLELGKVNLVGHSRGGAVAMLLASKHPELVKRLVLADPSPLFSMLQGQDKALQYLEKRKTVLKLSMQHFSGNNIEAGVKVFVNHIAGKNAWDKTTETRRNALRQNALTLKSLIRDVEVPFSCQDLKKISAPVLMVTGEYSKPVYGQMNKAVSACLKEPRKATVADAGHMMYAANPTAFLFEVQDFIETE